MTQGVGDAVSLTPGRGTDLLEPLAPDADSPKVIRGRSPIALAFDRLRRDRGAMVSLGVIILIVLCAIFAPVFAHITGHPPNEQSHDLEAQDEFGQPHGPSSTFWF